MQKNVCRNLLTLDIKGLAFASHSVAQLTEDLLANTPCLSDFNSSHSPGNPLNSICPGFHSSANMIEDSQEVSSPVNSRNC